MGAIESQITRIGKLRQLARPARYKVVYGGRGKGASWGMARQLLLDGADQRLRILCTREVQRTIADSVHMLLKDQIDELDLGDHYLVTDNEIAGANGTMFRFAGLNQLSARNLKSFEGYDRAWVEEAEAITKKSWEILIPTIRKPGSEIWVNLNPALDSDPTYQRFVVNTPPDTILIKMTWADNPFFPAVLEKERLYLQETDPEAYDNVWEGNCRATVEGAIYANEIREAMEGKRIRPVPYDPMLKVHTVWDLGFDTTSVGFFQRYLNQLLCIDFQEWRQAKYNLVVEDIKARRYNLGLAFLPHDATHNTPLPIDNPITVIRQLGLAVAPPLPNEHIELGIRRLRMLFSRIYFDEVKCAPLVEHLRRYRRTIPKTTEEPSVPMHDEHSHAADMLRYAATAVDRMSNDPSGDGPLPVPNTGIM